LTPDELFGLARLRATINWPQLAPAVWALHAPLAVEGLYKRCGGAVATDMRWRLYYDPEMFVSFTPGQAATALVHEAWHCLRRHADRAQVPVQWRRAANVARDCEINGDMNRCTPPPQWPYDVHTPKDLRMPNGLPWEEYFPAAQELVGAQLSGCSGGSSSDGAPRDWECPGGTSPAERESVCRSVARAIKSSAYGTVPLGWTRWAERAFASPGVPWQRMLALAVRGGLATDAGAFDFSRQRPSRRQGSSAVLLSTLRRPLSTVYVLVDTSCSMSAADLTRVLSEVEGIIKATGAGVRVCTCDTQVHGGTQRVQHANAVQLRGGGGTDMAAGMAYIEKQRLRADVLVVITDGETPWPKRKPRITKVVVALVGGRTKLGSLPRWATGVEVGA
jgi:predicted metal-dependent peptidase